MGELHPGSTRWQEREWLRSQPESWWADVFDRIACGESAKTVVGQYAIRWGMFGRVLEEQPNRQAEYEAALRVASDGFAHEVVEIADEQKEAFRKDGSTFDPDVGRDKLRIESRLKVASKWHQQRYGDKVDVRHGGAVGGLTIVLAQLSAGEQEKVISPERVVQERVRALLDDKTDTQDLTGTAAGEVVLAATHTGPSSPQTPPRQAVPADLGI